MIPPKNHPAATRAHHAAFALHAAASRVPVRRGASAVHICISCLACAATATLAPAAQPLVVTSPGGRVKAEVTAENGVLRYSVSLDGRQVLEPSELGIRSDGTDYGRDTTLGAPVIREVNEVYPFFGGKSQATNAARVATVPLASAGKHFDLDLHVADDGVGARLRLPAQKGRKVEADLSGWKLPGDPVVWAMPYENSYEEHYRQSRLSSLDAKPHALPVTAKVGNDYITLSEAALKDYGDLAVKRREDGVLAGFLAHDPRGWTTDDEVVQPWRAAIVSPDLTGLVNSTLVQNLNPPAEPSLLDAPWIKPGRSTWQWMAVGAPKFEDQHRWVDWTKELGYEYYLVDEGWSGWRDAWASLKSVCDYAKSQGVKIWLWVHSKEVKDPQARKEYFRRAADTGVVGVKVDFPRPTDRWWSTWYNDTARDAAAQKLLVDFHGASKPTGMERTWPNELTREGVRGHEYHITRYKRLLEAQHDTILPFTRYVVGHGDYTPTVFEAKELQGNTWAHELAQAVVFTSPFLCMGGHPKDYVASPAKDVISALPATWDETAVLPCTEPGKVAAFARRRGDQWFVGVLNGAEKGQVEIPLRFLGPGRWKATRLGDVEGKADAFDRRDEEVTADSVFRVELAARGGFVAQIKK